MAKLMVAVLEANLMDLAWSYPKCQLATVAKSRSLHRILPDLDPPPRALTVKMSQRQPRTRRLRAVMMKISSDIHL